MAINLPEGDDTTIRSENQGVEDGDGEKSTATSQWWVVSSGKLEAD